MKILVSNRGEIALRIMRSLKEMNISTVAVFSEADRNSPHVSYADEAICIGSSSSSDSYLRGDKIVAACKKLNVDAVHPGYGFLSENEKFAELINDSGIIFIGPSPDAIKTMGNKLAAKKAIKDYDVPMIPGTDNSIKSISIALKKAKEIGYPILIKASLGGGGKGMRIVKNKKDFKEALKLAMNEAIAAFGDGSVFLEKHISSSRHIEIQILADTHGNCIHLFERECSIQRRHQKIIEEAPSSVLSSELRNQMGKVAISVAKACNYVGAGTVEFLLDEDCNFYFLEMNTRLQVEHPVTEMITGLDLVKEQVKIAMGEKLLFNQNDITINGHAIETRIYAEDPSNDFLPETGVLEVYKRPLGIGVRLDDGYEEGMEIPIYYDSMISKLITHGRNREESIQRMKRALNEYIIGGVTTTIAFSQFVMNSKAFYSGIFNTNFIIEHFKKELLNIRNKEDLEVAAVLAAKIIENYGEQKKKETKKSSNWKRNRLNFNT